MTSSKWEIKIYSNFYDNGYTEYGKPITNVTYFLDVVLDEIESLYNQHSIFKRSIDSICSYNSVKNSNNSKNRKGISFNQVKSYSNSLDPQIIKDDIRKHIGINANIVLSSDLIFFIVYHTKTDAEIIIKSLASKLNQEMNDFYIEINGDFFPKKNINGNNNREIDMKKHLFYNKIIFGPTGTGKSTLCDKYKELNEIVDKNLLRTTFYEEYSYYDFFGQYKPIVLRNANETLNVSTGDLDEDDTIKLTDINIRKHIITYQFVSGIFFKAILKAKYNQRSDSKKVMLIIEEINRGNCSAIFGDMFQLLDRGENGDSVYKLTLSSDVRRFLLDKLVDAEKNNNKLIDGIPAKEYSETVKDILIEDKIYIPHNLIIIGTMNTSDQSLFPIDSAFKRRWDMEYCDINYKDELLKNTKLENTNISWLSILEKINERILAETKSEDKQIGQWFIKPVNDVILIKDFKSKVISYLFFDVFKHFPKVFNCSYSKLINKDIADILAVFDNDKN